jgi:hypothetical protein
VNLKCIDFQRTPDSQDFARDRCEPLLPPLFLSLKRLFPPAVNDLCADASRLVHTWVDPRKLFALAARLTSGGGTPPLLPMITSAHRRYRGRQRQAARRENFLNAGQPDRDIMKSSP